MLTITFSGLLFQGLFTQGAMASPIYDGPEIEHTFSTKRPNTLKMCEEDRFNTSLDLYKMCAAAQQAAENFAEQFAQQEGSIQGYLRVLCSSGERSRLHSFYRTHA